MHEGKYTYNEPEYWGWTTWDYFIKMALSSPQVYTLYDRNKYKEWLSNCLDIIPCPECKRHAKVFVSKHEITSRNKKELLEYILKLRHNADHHAMKKRRFDINIWKEKNPL